MLTRSPEEESLSTVLEHGTSRHCVLKDENWFSVVIVQNGASKVRLGGTATREA